MSSDAPRLLEIQLDFHKRRLQERGERIQELEARNIDLEAQVNHLQEIVNKQRTHSKDGAGPADLNKTQDGQARDVAEDREGEAVRSDGHPSTSNNSKKKRSESDRGQESESGGLESKRRRLSPEVAVQPRSFDSRHYATDNSGGHNAAAGVRNPNNNAKEGPSEPPIRQPNQSPRNLPRSSEPAPVPTTSSAPGGSRGGIFGPTSRTYDLVTPYQQRTHPAADSDPDSDSSYQLDDYEDGVQAARGTSPKSALVARTANVESFDHGIVAEEFLDATADRQTLGKRLNCSGNGTVVCSRDGTDFLFPNRKQHPYAPVEQGTPGLFFSAIVDTWTLSGAHEVFVGISPGKYKYMGEYRLHQIEALSPGEFKALPRGTKSLWANSILKQKKYAPIRHRLVQNRKYSSTLDAQDIVRAYEKGAEKLFVWRMKCIEYDDELLSLATGLPLEEGHC